MSTKKEFSVERSNYSRTTTWREMERLFLNWIWKLREKKLNKLWSAE